MEITFNGVKNYSSHWLWVLGVALGIIIFSGVAVILSNYFSQQGVVSDGDKWTTFEDERFNFTFDYPTEYYVDVADRRIELSPLAPDDPKRASSVGIVSGVTITLKDMTSLDEVIQEYRSHEDADIYEYTINGISAVRVEEFHPYFGSVVPILFIDILGKIYSISYDDVEIINSLQLKE